MHIHEYLHITRFTPFAFSYLSPILPLHHPLHISLPARRSGSEFADERVFERMIYQPPEASFSAVALGSADQSPEAGSADQSRASKSAIVEWSGRTFATRRYMLSDPFL